MTQLSDPPPATALEPRFREVGRSPRRNDAREKIVGETRYAGDFELPGMLHARLVRSSVPSATLVRRDVTGALEIPGVVAVYLGEDVPHNDISLDVPGQQLAVEGLRALSQILATTRVRYHGEPIALIVATDPDVLTEAEPLVEIDYDEFPCVLDPEHSLDRDSPLVHESGNLNSTWSIDSGDVDGAFKVADVIVEGEYHCQTVDPGYLEPEAGVAWLDDDGVITIRSSTQVVEHYRDVAKILGLPHGKVRVLAPYLGGGFGGKEDMTVEPFVALAAYRTGRPVRMEWSRQESLMARAKRHPMRFRYRTAARSDGTILAHDVDVLSDAGAYPNLSAYVLLYMAVNVTGPYRCPNARVRSRAVYTNNTPNSAMRGFGSMQAVLAYEAQMDRLAAAVGMDRAEIRRLNSLEKGDTIPVGQRVPTAVWLRQCIDAVLEAAGPRPVTRDDRHVVGRGLGCNIHPYGRVVWLNDSSSAWIGFEMDGSLVIRCGVTDVGGGQVTSLAQIAAEVLGVGMDRITVHFGDSSRTPLAGTTTATRQLMMSGNATLEAARQLRRQILAAVSEARQVPESDLDMVPGGVSMPGELISIPDALAMCIRAKQPISAMATHHAPRGTGFEGSQVKADRIYPDATFGAHIADVEVDLDTGQVRVLSYIACHDVGRAIDPLRVKGQMAGAVAMGIGYALSERIVFEDGFNRTAGLFQYAMPNSLDVPDVRCIVLESGEGLGPFGARGIGEPPIGPCAATISSAVEDAIGVRPTRIPVLAEDVVSYLASKAERDRSR